VPGVPLTYASVPKSPGVGETIFGRIPVSAGRYFSRTNIRHDLDNVEEPRQKAANGKLPFGKYRHLADLAPDAGKVHVMRFTAMTSRTMLYNIKDLKWDENILKES